MDLLKTRKEKVYQVYRSFQPKEDYIAIGFRISLEQKDALFQLVRSGSEHAANVSRHMLKNALAQKIVIIGNEKFRVRIRERLCTLDSILEQLEGSGQLSGSDQEELRMIREIRNEWEGSDAIQDRKRKEQISSS